MLSLVKYSKNKVYSNIELNAALIKNNFDERDKIFFTRLFYGVIEKIITLDYYISKISDKTIKKLDIYTLNILRMGIYQLEYMDRVPNNAACNESVNLAKKYSVNSAGFVNAVLRNYIRRKNEIHKSIDYLDEISGLEVKYSCSADIIKLWIEQYGVETTEKLLESSAVVPDTTVTINSLKISRDEYTAKISQESELIKTKISPYGLTFLNDISIKNLYGFDGGLCYVQDEASQICALETQAKEGDFVIDCCAAPGGKSFYMSQMMNNKGKIISLDLHKNKLKLIENSAKRLGIDIIEAREHNSQEILSEYLQRADIVLCDVPCSGFGVINKKPEIKYKTADDISELPRVQLKILTACSAYVKENGLLIYSTCTLNKTENEDIIEMFLEKNKNFKCVDFVNISSKTAGIKTFFPFENKIDGFFLAKMKRFSV